MGLAALSAATGTGYTIYAGEEAKQRAEDQARAAREANAEALKEAKAQREQAAKQYADQQAKLTDESSRDSAAYRQMVKSKGAYGRSDTVLTSPLGVMGSGSTNKTILGG